jgi:hypothetical protein
VPRRATEGRGHDPLRVLSPLVFKTSSSASRTPSFSILASSPESNLPEQVHVTFTLRELNYRKGREYLPTIIYDAA